MRSEPREQGSANPRVPLRLFTFAGAAAQGVPLAVALVALWFADVGGLVRLAAFSLLVVWGVGLAAWCGEPSTSSALGRFLVALLVTCAGAAVWTLSPISPALLHALLVAGTIVSIMSHSEGRVRALATGAVATAHAVAGVVVGHPGAAAVIAVVGVSIVGGLFALEPMLSEQRRRDRMFELAMSAATELSGVLARLGSSIEQARRNERVAERRRIAREIHDNVGHTLTALIVQIEVVEQLVNVESVRERIRSLRDMSRNALIHVRSEVTRLRTHDDEGKDWREECLRLCDVFSECVGIRVDRRIAPELKELDPRVGEHVYGIIQEALTNSYRHGRATLVDIASAVKPDPSRLLVRISDDGYGCDDPRDGNGLRGIRERVDELGGALAIDSDRGRGFNIGVEIPIVQMW